MTRIPAGFTASEQNTRIVNESGGNDNRRFLPAANPIAAASSRRHFEVLITGDWTAFARRYNGTGQVARYAGLMEAAYRRHAGGAKSPVVLRVGARGAAVKELHRALGIETDGAFGPQTLRAVRQFQSDAGLEVDGVVGQHTWAALQARDADCAPDAWRPVRPPAQPTTGDAMLERVTSWTGAFSAVTAAVAGASEALPEGALNLVLIAAVAGAVIAALAWVSQWARQ